MSKTDGVTIPCRACGYPVPGAHSVTCSECGLVHNFTCASTARDRLPHGWLAIVLLATSLVAALGFAGQAMWQQRRDRNYAEACSTAASEAEARMRLHRAIIDDASRDVRYQRDSESWRVSHELINQRAKFTTLHTGRLSISMWVACVFAGMSAIPPALLAWRVHERRFGELSPADERFRKRLVVVWACMFALVWVGLLVSLTT